MSLTRDIDMLARDLQAVRSRVRELDTLAAGRALTPAESRSMVAMIGREKWLIGRIAMVETVRAKRQRVAARIDEVSL